MTAQNCSGDVCNYVHYSDSLNSSASVAVNIIGCDSKRISVKEMSSCKTILSYIYHFYSNVQTGIGNACTSDLMRHQTVNIFWAQ